MTASAHFTAHADGTLTCRYGHVVPDGQLADHLHPEPNRNTAPTPGDTYALIAARQTDPETRRRPRVGFTIPEEQPR